jgi:protoporphyrinogen oxidase
VARVVILGAGLSGLSAAYHLEKNNFFDYKIFEKESIPGGLLRSTKHEGFTFDFTGHLLHISDDYFKNFLQTIAPENSFNKLTRKAFIHSHNIYTPYPFQMNLNGLPNNVIKECIKGFVERPQSSSSLTRLRQTRYNFIPSACKASVSRDGMKTTPKNFYDWVLKYFGKGIGKHFLFPYNSKLLSVNLKDVHHSWTGRFVPKINLNDILEGALQKRSFHSVGYNHTFFYPKTNGIQYLIDCITKNIKTKINTDFAAKTIDTKNKCVIFENGHIEKFDILITTLPLNDLLNKLKTPTNNILKQSADKLLCNSVVNFNLGLNIKNLTDKHWVYTPEKKYPFYRFGFWNNFSQNMTPKNCSALYGEFSYIPGLKSRKQILNTTKKSIEQTCSILGISNKNIVAKKILPIPRAYVIYNKWREKYLPKIHKQLNGMEIYSIGRYGAWKYSSMQEAVIDGKEISENILQQNAFKKEFQPAIKTIDLTNQDIAKNNKIKPTLNTNKEREQL